MALTPSQPNQESPTWGQAYGLLSFQIMGVLAVSVISYLLDVQGNILNSIIATIFFSTLYGSLAEFKVPGALSRRKLRSGIALRASIILSCLGLLTIAVFDGTQLIESGRVGVRAALIAFGFVLYYLSMWLGLELGSRFVPRKRGDPCQS